MCGIVGIVTVEPVAFKYNEEIVRASNLLNHRGPDGTRFYSNDHISFGHCRLSIIDLSEAANQPMTDSSGRFCIIYNGEIFNFPELKQQLIKEGTLFRTQSDTEVLLQMYIRYGDLMLNKLNGFYAFAIFDHHEKKALIARDRFGVKPLYYFLDDGKLFFASELRSLRPFIKNPEVDQFALLQYLQLNYIAAPRTIYRGINTVQPGQFITFQNGKLELKPHYFLSARDEATGTKYSDAQKQLFNLLDDAVRIRLISDVPLGSFLSGGLDSSVVSGLAARYTSKLHTFSVGFSDDDFFDETKYAQLVAKHFKTEHTVFRLRRSDLAESATEVLSFLDEPFADSSALLVNILSRKTREQVKVALSGDGADELFGGYIKHVAEYRARHLRLTELIARSIHPLLRLLPQSRNHFLSNKIRQLNRFMTGMNLSPRERYWYWCSIASEADASGLLSNTSFNLDSEWTNEKERLTSFIRGSRNLNDILLNDFHLVLPNDMLHKVDAMSMMHGLEVRTPFLDFRLVEWAFTLNSNWKMDRARRKKIVNDTFKEFLPPELFHRPKKGFEVPLHSLLLNELSNLVNGELLNHEFVSAQSIFDSNALDNLKRQLVSNNPQDSPLRIWALLVFQCWWKRNF